MKSQNIDPNFWSTLAGLRFFFAMWVLFDHTWNFTSPEHALPVLTRSGFGAVYCFFIISGFSIHHSISQKPAGFLWRRFWRIYPNVVTAGALAWICYSGFHVVSQYAVPAGPPRHWQWICNLFLLQGILPSPTINMLTPNWSIALEVLLYGAATRLVGWSRNVIGLLAVASLVLQVTAPIALPHYQYGIAFGLAAACVAWTWLAGWIAYAYPSKGAAAVFVVAGCLYMACHPVFFGITDLASAAVNGVAWSATVLIVFFRWDIQKSPRWQRILDYLGDLSFPLYVIHYPVLYVLTGTLLKHSQWNTGWIHVLAALGAAVILLHLVDRPLRYVRKPAFLTFERNAMVKTGAPVA